MQPVRCLESKKKNDKRAGKKKNNKFTFIVEKNEFSASTDTEGGKNLYTRSSASVHRTYMELCNCAFRMREQLFDALQHTNPAMTNRDQKKRIVKREEETRKSEKRRQERSARETTKTIEVPKERGTLVGTLLDRCRFQAMLFVVSRVYRPLRQ